MKLQIPRQMCVAKPEPRAWARDGRSGITYRAFFSDGKEITNCYCSDESVYEVVQPFQAFDITLDFQQMQNGTRIVLMQAVPAK